ncbi:MAG: cache domain-containing protein [Candidatus Cloacimonetes bacterium]|nr:cache domain-containing protein [Candidatus Cloacimonadota bacterium]
MHKRQLTIKQEMKYYGMVFSLIILIVFGTFLSVYFISSTYQNVRLSIQATNNRISTYVDGLFREIVNTLEILVDLHKTSGYKINSDKEKARMLKMYNLYSESNSNIKYIYSGLEDGSLLIDNYITPQQYDSRERPWYKSAIKSKPVPSVGLPYRDINTNEWLISQSKAITDDNGTDYGVMAIDINIDDIATLLSRKYQFKTQRSYVILNDGTIVIHPDQKYIGQIYIDILNKIESDSGFIRYDLEKRRVWAYYEKIPTTGWTMITAVDRSEIINPIIIQMSIFLFLTLILSFILGFILETVFARRIAKPLIQLGERVNAITSGKDLTDNPYRYSNSEIARIADNIEKLAEKSLNKKTRELHAILSSTADGILVIDRSEKVVYFNRQIIDLLEITEEIVLSTNINFFYDHVISKLKSPESFASHTKPLHNSSLTRTLELPLKNGKTLECFSTPFEENDLIVGRVWSFRDISLRKKAESDLMKQHQYQKIVAEVSAEFVNSNPQIIDLKLNSMFTKIGNFLEIDRVFIAGISSDEKSIVISNEWCGKNLEQLKDLVKDIEIKQLHWLSNLIENHKPVNITDSNALPDEADIEKQYLSTCNIKSLIALPMIKNHKFLGYFGFATNYQHRVWDESLIEFLVLLTNVITDTMVKNKLELDMLRTKEQLIKLEKKNAILAMAVTANHEINQPLMIIRGNAEILQAKLTDQSNEKHFTRIYDSLERIQELLLNLQSINEVEFTSYTENTNMIKLNEQIQEE